MSAQIKEAENQTNDKQTLIETLEKQVKEGDLEAQHNLGCMYLKGEIPGGDKKKGLELVVMAGNNGHIESKILLGSFFKRDPKSIEKAKEWFTKAANQGNVDGQIQLGLLYLNYEPKDIKKSLELFEQASKSGSMVAQFICGTVYLSLQNIENALEWFEKAGNQGHVDAQFNLGVLHNSGERKDLKKAVYWFEKAATQNKADAQALLGHVFECELSFKDLNKAKFWYEKSAKQNNVTAQFKLGTLYYFSGDDTRARELFEQAIKQGCESSKGFLERINKGKKPTPGAKTLDEEIALLETQISQRKAIIVSNLTEAAKQTLKDADTKLKHESKRSGQDKKEGKCVLM